MESRINPSRDDEDSSISERLNNLAKDIKKLSPDRIETLEKFVHSMGKKAISLKEAAEMIGMSKDTIRRAIKSGKLKAFQLNEGGNYRIPMEEIERFMRGENRND